MFLAVCIPKAKGHRVMENSSSPLVLSCLAPGKGSTQGSASVSHPWVIVTLSLVAGHWAGTNVCPFCRHKDGVGPSSQPLWPAEGRVIPALVSSLCSLKSSTELEGSGYSSIAGAAATGNSFPAKHLKSIGMVQSFVLHHQLAFVLLFQLAVVYMEPSWHSSQPSPVNRVDGFVCDSSQPLHVL